MPRLALILIAAALAGCATQQPPQQYVVKGCQPEMTAQECEAALVAGHKPGAPAQALPDDVQFGLWWWGASSWLPGIK